MNAVTWNTQEANKNNQILLPNGLRGQDFEIEQICGFSLFLQPSTYQLEFDVTSRKLIANNVA